MTRFKTLLLAGVMLLVAQGLRAQAWSGQLDPSRAIDWTTAGIPGGIPERSTICQTLNPGASSTQVNSAISACPAGQVVFLSPGNYTLTGGINWGQKSGVTLRGAGANSTFLTLTGNVNCRGLASGVCLSASNNPGMPSPSSTANWTAGYAKGSTSITLSSTSGLGAGSLLILDQLDDASDTGGVFVCATSGKCSGEGGNSYGRSGRAQQQIVKVTGVSGNTVTISPGLQMPNWRISQSPAASWAAAASPTGNGIENLSLNFQNSGAQAGITVLYTWGNWVKGIRSLNANRSHIWLYQSAGNVVRDSYFYGTKNAASQSYGVETFSSSSNLIENNIFQHVTGPITVNGADSGGVYSYNFAIDDNYAVSANWMIPSFILHESGIAMDLFEGNSGLGLEGDAIHGTHHFITAFRNHLYGDIYNNPPKSNNTAIVNLWAFSRFFNVVGNVLGRSDFYNSYDSGSSTSVYGLGSGSESAPNDPRVATTLMRWGNYDTVTDSSRYLPSEVPSGLSQFANPVPSSQVLPASYYLPVKPSWFGAIPFPPIGPDVTAGNVAGYAGHANQIPAQACFLGPMGGSMQGPVALRNFDAAVCYASGPPPVDPPPSTAYRPVILGDLAQAQVGTAYSDGLEAQATTPNTWGVSSDVPGLSFNTATGTFTGTPTLKGTFTLTFNLVDSYVCPVNATDCFNTAIPKTLDLVVTDVPTAPVLIPQTIQSIPAESYTTNLGVNPANQTFVVSDTSPINATLVISTTQPWLKAVSSTGNTSPTNKVTVSVNVAGLAAGTYTGSVVVTIPDQAGYTWTNSPYNVLVTLTVKGVTPVTPTGTCTQGSNPPTCKINSTQPGQSGTITIQPGGAVVPWRR